MEVLTNYLTSLAALKAILPKVVSEDVKDCNLEWDFEEDFVWN